MLERRNVKRFESWLASQGAEMIPVTSEHELIRFRCKKGIGVVYTGKRGISVSGALVTEAVKAWAHALAWDGKPDATNRKKKSGRKDSIIKRDGHLCFYCQKEFQPDELTIEHIVALSCKGPDRLENCVLACEPCNLLAGNKSAIDKVRLRERLSRATT